MTHAPEQQQARCKPCRALKCAGLWIPLLLVIALAVLVFRSRTYIDYAKIRQAVRGAPARTVLWEPPRLAESLMSGATDHYAPAFSSDGQTVVFVRKRAGRGADLYISHRTQKGWSEARRLDDLNTEYDEMGPSLGPGGRDIFFFSNRPGGLGGYDIYVARLDGATWANPVNLGPEINSPYDEYSPAICPDGRRLLYSSNRPRRPLSDRELAAWPATLRELHASGPHDIYIALHKPEQDTGGGKYPLFAAAEPLTALNSPAYDGQPSWTPRGDFVYFASNRDGGLGGFDLYRARVVADRFHRPENLGGPVNSADDEMDPALTAHGYALMFSSNRGVASQLDEGGKEIADGERFLIYETVSREVESVYEMSGLWRRLYLLGLILALLGLLLLILWLISKLADPRFRRTLTMLQRCLLTSLVLHLLLALLLGSWTLIPKMMESIYEDGEVLALDPDGFAAERLALSIRETITALPESDDDALLTATSAEPLTVHNVLPPLLTVDNDLPDSAFVVEAAAVGYRAAPENVASQTKVAGEMEQVRIPEMAAFEFATLHGTLPEVTAAERDESLAQDFQADPAPVAVYNAHIDVPAAAPLSDGSAAPETATVGDLAATESMARMGLPPAPRAEPLAPARTAFQFPAEMLSPDPYLPLAQPETVTADAGEAPVDIEAQETVYRAAAPSTVLPDAPALREALVLDVPVARVARYDQDFLNAKTVQPRGMHEEMTLQDVSTNKQLVAVAKPGLLIETPMEVGGALRDTSVETEQLMPLSAADDPVRPRMDEQKALASRMPGRLERAAVPMPQPSPVSASRFTPAESQQELRHETDQPQPARVPVMPATDVPAAATALTQPAPVFDPARHRDESPSMEEILVHAAAQRLTLPDSGAGPRGMEDRDPDSTPTLSAPQAIMPRAVPHEVSPFAKKDAPPETMRPALPFDTGARELTLEAPADTTFAMRNPDDRKRVIERLGGSEETESAVRLALQWFKDNQEEDGRWSNDRHGGAQGHDVAATGLALLCYYGYGERHDREGPYRETLQRALEWIIATMDESGNLTGGQRSHGMYSHGIGTLALAEAYAITRDPALREPAQRAVHFTAGAQNSDHGGWRYQPDAHDGDTSVVVWQVMALTSATIGGLEVPDETWMLVERWLSQVAGGQHEGIYGYQRPESSPRPALVASGMFTRQLKGARAEELRMSESAAYLLERLPDGRSMDYYYWYVASLAMYQYQGDEWDRWNERIQPLLLEKQIRDGPDAGSWVQEGQWSSQSGRAVTTALATLTLEVYYRYLPLYQPLSTF